MDPYLEPLFKNMNEVATEIQALLMREDVIEQLKGHQNTGAGLVFEELECCIHEVREPSIPDNVERYFLVVHQALQLRWLTALLSGILELLSKTSIFSPLGIPVALATDKYAWSKVLAYRWATLCWRQQGPSIPLAWIVEQMMEHFDDMCASATEPHLRYPRDKNQLRSWLLPFAPPDSVLPGRPWVFGLKKSDFRLPPISEVIAPSPCQA